MTAIPSASYNFRGKQIGGKASPTLQVLAGDTGPVISGGGAKWQTIDRPLARGVTIFQGYDPVQMSVAVRFGSWGSDLTWFKEGKAPGGVENDIALMESWWGTKINAGSPSIVTIITRDASGAKSPLIPQRYWEMQWVITNIEYGTAIRNPNGYRIRQDATITLENYLNFGSIPSAPETQKGGYVTTKRGMDTALQIAAASDQGTGLAQQLAVRILNSAKNNPMHGSHIKLSHKHKGWHIPDGKKVWVPSHATQ